MSESLRSSTPESMATLVTAHSVLAAKAAQARDRRAAEVAAGIQITDDGAVLTPRKVLIFPTESSVERAAHSAVCALDDLEAAVQCAATVGELDLLTTLASELQAKLWQCERAARTYREHFDEMRGQ